MKKSSRIFVAGHRGLVGSAIVRTLTSEGYTAILTRTREQLDLLDQRAVHEYFAETRPEFVFVAAARVGGIHANSTAQTEFLYENLVLSANLIHAAAQGETTKLLYLGSSCVYPRGAPQPMKEDALLTGPLEPTNEGYAIAKIAALKLCEYYNGQQRKRFISVMPTNLYGVGDNFHPLNSHVIPGMMRRFHEAKQRGQSEVWVWGSGKPRREFLYVDDLAQALLLLMDGYEDPLLINVGAGEECTIAELAELMKKVVGFSGTFLFDASKPDGSPRKLLDSSRIRSLGWRPRYNLEKGLEKTYQWALAEGVFDRTREPRVSSAGLSTHLAAGPLENS